MNCKKIFVTAFMSIFLVSCIGGCSSSTGETASPGESSSTGESSFMEERSSTSQNGSTEAEQNTSAAAFTDEEMFTDRDMDASYDAESATVITLADNSSHCDSDHVTIEGNSITITDEGTYLLQGTLSDGQVIVDAENAKLQLVLNGVSITNDSSAALYIRQADKVFLTLAPDTQNSLSVTGTFEAIDDNNIDGTIFSKDDLTLNGSGSLTVSCADGHGIVGKDDLVITGGTYQITASKQALSGKDSVRIADGTFTLSAGTDGIHSQNEEDTSKGFIYISGGNISVTESYEGMEAKVIYIAGGDISIVARDDGLNATDGSSGEMAFGGNMDSDGVYIQVAGGTLSINADGDGIDSNGDLYVSGGETYVSGPTNNGNGALDYQNSAIISGGILVAVGASGMAENFGTDSTQGSILVNLSGTCSESGTDVTLTDSAGNVLITYSPEKSYNSVVISCPELTLGESYILTAGGSTTTIQYDSLIYGNGMGQMGGGRMDMAPGNRGGMRR